MFLQSQARSFSANHKKERSKVKSSALVAQTLRVKYWAMVPLNFWKYVGPRVNTTSIEVQQRRNNSKSAMTCALA